MNIRNSKIWIDAAWKGLKHALSFEGPSPHHTTLTSLTTDDITSVFCTLHAIKKLTVTRFTQIAMTILPIFYLKNGFFLNINLHACFFYLVNSFSPLEVSFGPISGISTITMQPRQLSMGRCVRSKQWQKKTRLSQALIYKPSKRRN